MSPSNDDTNGAMEVSTGCHHTTNHSATLGATSSSVAVSLAQQKNIKSALASNKNHQYEATSSPQDSSSPAAHRLHRHGSHRSRSHGGNAPKGQFGFAVNGFHPQWSTSSNLLLASKARDITAFPINLHRGRLGRQSLNEQVATATSDLINRLRNDEEEKKNIRKRHLAEVAVAATKAQKRREHESPMAEESSETISSSSTSTNDGKQKRQPFSSLYGDVFLKSCTSQILVSPGGRILACKYHTRLFIQKLLA